MCAEILDVDIAAEAGVEQQVPAGMMVVVVDVDLVMVPLPIAAAVYVVRSHDPVGIVVKGHAARVVINAARDKNFSHVIVAPVRISAAGLDAVMVGIPIPVVLAIAMLEPALVVAVVVAVIAVAFLELVSEGAYSGKSLGGGKFSDPFSASLIIASAWRPPCWRE